MKRTSIIAAVASCCLMATPSSAQIGLPQSIGAWRLMDLATSCVLTTNADGQALEFQLLKTGGGLTFSSPLTSALPATSEFPVTIGLGAAGNAKLQGKVISAAAPPTVSVSLKMAVMLPLVKPLQRFVVRVGSNNVLDFALPADSAKAYDAFERCGEKNGLVAPK